MTEPGQLTGTALAYMGDAVIEILTRRALLESGIGDAGRLTAASRAFVTAKAQSEAFTRIESILTEDEADIFRRGRNAGVSYHPKNQTMADYRRATGFEALMGWLYLSSRESRALELFNAAYAPELASLTKKRGV